MSMPSCLRGRAGRFVRLCGFALVLALGAAPWARAAGIAITQPANEQTVHSNLGELTVNVRVTDAAPGSRVRLNVDGRAQLTTDGSVIALPGLDRGTHVLKAELLAADGQVIAASPPVTVYLWHASRRNPHRAP